MRAKRVLYDKSALRLTYEIHAIFRSANPADYVKAVLLCHGTRVWSYTSKCANFLRGWRNMRACPPLEPLHYSETMQLQLRHRIWIAIVLHCGFLNFSDYPSTGCEWYRSLLLRVNHRHRILERALRFSAKCIGRCTGRKLKIRMRVSLSAFSRHVREL